MGGFERYLSVTPPRDAAGRQTRRLRPEHERSRPLPATFLGPMNALAACHWKRTLELVLVLELALALALALVLEVMPELARPCVTVSHDAAHQSHLTRLIAAMAARLLSALRLLILGVLEHNFHPSCARRGQAAWSAWVGGRRQVMAPGWRVCQASRSRRSARRFGARRRGDVRVPNRTRLIFRGLSKQRATPKNWELTGCTLKMLLSHLIYLRYNIAHIYFEI